jgi:VWFA-related protein
MAAFGLTDNLLVLQDFTTDPDLIARAIDIKPVQSSWELNDQALNALQQADPFGRSHSQGFRLFQNEQIEAEMDVRIRETLGALESIARMAAGIPGRKTLVWVSGGIPLSLQLAERSFLSGQQWFRSELEYVSTLLNDAQVAIYPVDARGLVSDALADATAGNGFGPSFRSGMQSAPLLDTHDTMQEIASETGGVAYFNRNDIDHAVALAIADSSTYYNISYYSSNKKWDGNFRKIEIKCSRPGVRLRYRQGYFALDPKKERPRNAKETARAVDVALGGPMINTQITFYASAQPLRAVQAALPTEQVNVHFIVDMKNISFDSTANGTEHCTLDFYVVAFSGGKYVTQTAKGTECNFSSATYSSILSNGLAYDVPIELPEASYRLRLLVRDNESGKMGSLDVPYLLRVAQR